VSVLSHQHGFTLPKRQQDCRIKALSNRRFGVLNRAEG
jgi:hypothetical protein